MEITQQVVLLMAQGYRLPVFIPSPFESMILLRVDKCCGMNLQQTLLNNGFIPFLGANSASNPLDDSIFEIGSIYLEIQRVTMMVHSLLRTRIVSVPYARQAKTAFEVDGGVVNASEIRVDGNVVVDGAGELDWTKHPKQLVRYYQLCLLTSVMVLMMTPIH